MFASWLNITSEHFFLFFPQRRPSPSCEEREVCLLVLSADGYLRVFNANTGSLLRTVFLSTSMNYRWVYQYLDKTTCRFFLGLTWDGIDHHACNLVYVIVRILVRGLYGNNWMPDSRLTQLTQGLQAQWESGIY